MVTNARVETDALDDLFGVQPVGNGEGVKFVEVGDAHGEIGIGEKLYGLGFVGVGEEYGDVLFYSTLLEKAGKGFSTLGAFAYDDARRVEVVVEGAAFAKEFGGED